MIVVGIYNTGVRRISEYTPTKDARRRKGGKGDRYAKMMAQELKPFIDREYRTRRAAAHNGVGGSSLGGSGVAGDGPAVPARVRPAGDSLAIGMVGQSIYSGNGTGLQIGHAGAHLAGFGYGRRRCARRPAIADLKLLRDALVEKGWREGVDLRCTVVPGAGHNERAWGARFGEVLQYLFPRGEGNSGEPG